jgi:exopolysaccharide biosynthesis WecB/TagA/CpsF family protein
VWAEPGARVLDDIVNAIARHRGVRVAFANTHLLYHAIRDRRLARSLSRFVVLNDGVGLTLASRFACGAGFPDNLNGTDFTPRLLAAAPAGSRIFLYGARPRVVAEVASRIEAHYPHLQMCGARDGFGDSAENILPEMVKARPDVVLVALGNPGQEAFISHCAQSLPATTFVGVGALFDFMAGAVSRAPRWMRKIRMEWLYRLAHEPRRLWRRYTVEIAVVALALVLYRVRQGQS